MEYEMKDGYVKLNGKEVSEQILKSDGIYDFLEELANDIANDVNTGLSNVDSNEKAKVVVQKDRKKRAAVDVKVGKTKEVVENHLLEKAAYKKR